MRYLFITLSLLFILSGCQNNKESQSAHDAKIATQAKAELRAELQKEKEAKQQTKTSIQESKLSHVGITTTNGKIIIDTEKTKSFFQKMIEKIKIRTEKFTKEMQSGTINEKEAGIEVSDTRVSIDLNKTKSFLDTLGKTIESYAKDFQKMTEELNNSK